MFVIFYSLFKRSRRFRVSVGHNATEACVFYWADGAWLILASWLGLLPIFGSHEVDVTREHNLYPLEWASWLRDQRESLIVTELEWDNLKCVFITFYNSLSLHWCLNIAAVSLDSVRSFSPLTFLRAFLLSIFPCFLFVVKNRTHRFTQRDRQPQSAIVLLPHAPAATLIH